MKAGDKVRIIGKTKHPLNISTDEGLPFVYNGKTIWRKGDTGYISEIYPSGIFLSKTRNTKSECGMFQEFDLRLLPDLKAGDKVKILQKTAEGWENEYCATDKGGIGYVIRIGYEGKYIVVNRDPYAFGGDVFNPEDLILINEDKKEENMEYTKYVKGDRDLKVIDVINDETPNLSEKENFNESMLTDFGYNLYDTIEINEDFIEYVLSKNKCFIDWLISKEYVREIAFEKFKKFDVTLTISTKNHLDVLKTLIDINGDTNFKLAKSPKGIDEILDDFTQDLEEQGIYDK